MAKGITYSCTNVWRGIARTGGWWSLLRVARDWDGVFGMAEIEEHLATLAHGGFLEQMPSRREGTVYAYTARCRPLPCETLAPVTSPLAKAAASVPTAPQPDAMRSFYVPPQPTYRPGSQDYQQCPSLHMGQRRAYRSDAA